MSEQMAAGAHPATEAVGDAAPTREELQRRMEEARESIAQTVTEIKETVAEQYQTVKEAVADKLDWREYFRGNPAAWCFSALSVGFVVGGSLAGALKSDRGKDDVLSQLAALGDRLADRLSKEGMEVLLPLLSGGILVPLLTNKAQDALGLDLSDLTAKWPGQQDDAPGAKGKKKKKKGAGKKGGKKKAKAARADAAQS